MTQFAMIAASSRPNTIRRTYDGITGRGGMASLFSRGLISKPWLYYAHHHRREKVPEYFDTNVWEVFPVERGRPFIMNFYRMFERAREDQDFVFVEDDLSPCVNAMERIAFLRVPEDVGCVSFFDYRNEWKSPGLHVHPGPREFWGSQCLLFPGRHMKELKKLAVHGVIPMSDGTDVWAGLACERLGLKVANYSPSLVQHIGMLSAYSPGRERPVANNFPGESFDAMGECEDPVVPGAWEGVTESLWCSIHRKNHEPKDWGRCPTVTKTEKIW